MDNSPQAVVERLGQAQNAHDLEAMLACFAADYRSEQPVHPDRAFIGREQVRKNWSGLFSAIGDFHTELIRSVTADGTVWAELRWTGTKADGSPLDEVGVTILGVEDGLITWARLYMEEVDTTGAGIEAVVRRMAGREADPAQGRATPGP